MLRLQLCLRTNAYLPFFSYVQTFTHSTLRCSLSTSQRAVRSTFYFTYKLAVITAAYLYLLTNRSLYLQTRSFMQQPQSLQYVYKVD